MAVFGGYKATLKYARSRIRNAVGRVNRSGEKAAARARADNCLQRFATREEGRGREEESGIMRAVYHATSELLWQNLPAYLHSPAANADRN